MTSFQKIDKNTYFLRNRGHEMTLIKNGDKWEMWTTNSVVEAYRRGFITPKVFFTLEEVENTYKRWSGIAKLHAQAENNE